MLKERKPSAREGLTPSEKSAGRRLFDAHRGSFDLCGGRLKKLFGKSFLRIFKNFQPVLSSNGCFDGVEDEFDEFFVRVRHSDGGLCARDDSVRKYRDGYAADVIGDAIVASVNRGGDSCGVQKRKRASRADAH